MVRRRASGDIEGRLVGAALHLMRTRGLAHVTTREVARAAGVAEGTMYNHFHDKAALLVAALQRIAPATMRAAMAALPARVGTRSVAENLAEVTEALVAFHRQAAPVICALLADASLTHAAREALTARGVGPELSAGRLASYLAAERDGGRVAPGADVEAASKLLHGASFDSAVSDHLFGRTPDAVADAVLVERLVSAAMVGLAPREAAQDG